MACDLATYNCVHLLVAAFSMKDIILFGSEGKLMVGEAAVDDTLGELWEEEVVWGEGEVHHWEEDSAATGGERIHSKLGTKIRNGSHQGIRHRSMLSRQMEMQANTWGPASKLSAVLGAKQSLTGSGRSKVATERKDHEVDADERRDEGGLLDGLIPPHKLLARQYAASATQSFSVLQGAGRTLKGMDLCRLRNEVWRQTGFVD